MIYEESCLGIITGYAKLVGCWVTDAGTLNSVVFVRAYDDYGHRTCGYQISHPARFGATRSAVT